jgi:hypothetical protein
VVVDQAATGDHDARRVVVECREAVGRLGHERAVVVGAAGDVAQAFEGQHALHATGPLAQGTGRARP